MGILNFIENLQKKGIELQEKKEIELQQKVDALQKQLENSPLGKANAEHKNRKVQKICAEFYSDYPECPYVSADRPSDWPERARSMPKQCLVKREMMVRFSDNLLPGHVYMLYWLKKFTNKKVPVYFEYKYGINFEAEKEFLLEHGFLNNNAKPTPAGERAIQEHIEVIENHNPPKPDRSIDEISKQILAQRDNIVKNGGAHYEFMANSGCCEKCAALDGKHFRISNLKIGVNAPPMHEGCRCCITEWFDRVEYETWLKHIEKGGTTEEWEAKKANKTSQKGGKQNKRR